MAVVWMSASAQRLVGPFKSEQAVYAEFDAYDGIIRKGKYAGSRVIPRPVEPLESATSTANESLVA
ncbi:MAG TPA: hypothetical protein VMU25_00870 [Candidatus Paceibacterota bacterium]|nr:hypothetical protein [Candidatus Paceibacterota bacterium]